MEHILLVDDDPTARACLRDFLELKGCRCVEADHGAAALEKIAEGSVSLLLTPSSSAKSLAFPFPLTAPSPDPSTTA